MTVTSDSAMAAAAMRGLNNPSAANGIAIYELTPKQASLEEAFMSLTRSEIEFASLLETDLPPADHEAA